MDHRRDDRADARALPVAERREIVRQGLAVALATGTYGVGFGAVGVASGLSVLQTCALSLLMFTGASQFAFAGVLAAGGAPRTPPAPPPAGGGGGPGGGGAGRRPRPPRPPPPRRGGGPAP
jgi:hypothetical protein